ncbi:MAG: nickel/cobalt transporter [Methylobacteriaceae bacterium]|nr:nickel/cobalt transporter [Methylobacteriaceae bacterium]
MPLTIRQRNFALALAGAAVALLLADGSLLAQTGRNPFAFAGNEGSVDPVGIGGWLLAQQAAFYQMITGAVRAAKADGSAVWTLAGISFAYGIFHAAGPGHGKAVVASYMIANERALRRGLVISFLAALLQGLVAIAIVTVAVFVLGVPARGFTQSASSVIETASYAGVAILGAWLVWRKGRDFIAAVRHRREAPAQPAAVERIELVAAAAPARYAFAAAAPAHAFTAAIPVRGRHGHCHQSSAPAHPQGHIHDEHCGHFHAPDPRTLGTGFSWRTAAVTVFSAGSRPCVGALFVLVFALAQGLFAAGMAAVLAMSLGTAITTGALAVCAVFFKGLAVRLAGGNWRRSELIARGVEVLAAAVVLLVGIGLLVGFVVEGA